MISNPNRDSNTYFTPESLKEHLFPNLNIDQVEFLITEIIKEKPELIKNVEKKFRTPLAILPTGLVESFLEKGGFTKIENDQKKELVKQLERDAKNDKLLDLDLKLKSFESKIGKKIIIAGFIITFFSFLITILTLKFWNTDSNTIEQKDETNFQEKPIIKLTEFKNGRWISTTDSLAGIEIKNGKWIMFYKGMEIDSSDIYDFKIKREYITELGTEHKPFEFLTLTNNSDTLDYSILECSDQLLSLSYIPRGNTLNYKPEK